MKLLPSLLLSLLFIMPFNVLAIDLPDLGGSSSQVMSPEMEQEIASSILKQLKNSHQLIDDAELTDYIQSLGFKLIEHSPASQQSFQFHLIDSEQINAFATPGGLIAVNSGLFIATETESELASVLAHEIAHVSQQHIARIIEKSQSLNLPMTIGMIAAVLLGASTSADIGMAATAGLSAYSAQQQINFTREHEIEADSVGMDVLHQTGFNPYAMSSFFQKLQSKNRYMMHNYPEFLLTHPVTSNRIADTQAKAESYRGIKHLSKNNDTAYQLMKIKTEILTSKNIQQTLINYQNSFQDDTENSGFRYAYGLSLLATEQNDKAIEVLIPLQKSTYNSSYITTAISRALSSSSKNEHQQQALTLLSREYQNDPQNIAIISLYSKILLKNNQPDKSLQILTKYINYRQANSQIYELLSLTHNELNQPIQAEMTQAEYYYLEGEYTKAVFLLKSAQKKLQQSQEDHYYLKARINSRLKVIEQQQKKIKEQT